MGGAWYNESEKSITDKSGLLKGYLLVYGTRSRHLAEWRLLLFTVIVMVIEPTWNVNVMGIASTPFIRSVADRLIRIMAILFPAPVGVIYNANKKDGICQYKVKNS